MSSEYFAEIDELDDVDFEQEDVIEIDYYDYGFVLQSPVDRADWVVYFHDPEKDPLPVPVDLDQPVQVMGKTFTAEMMQKYEELRKYHIDSVM